MKSKSPKPCAEHGKIKDEYCPECFYGNPREPSNNTTCKPCKSYRHAHCLGCACFCNESGHIEASDMLHQSSYEAGYVKKTANNQHEDCACPPFHPGIVGSGHIPDLHSQPQPDKGITQHKVRYKDVTALVTIDFEGRQSHIWIGNDDGNHHSTLQHKRNHSND